MVYLLSKLLFYSPLLNFSSLVIIYLILIIIFFNLTFLAIIRLLDISYWEKQLKRIYAIQENKFLQLSPLIDLGKLTLSVAADLTTPLTSLWIIIDAIRLNKIYTNPEKLNRYLNWANDIFFDLKKLLDLGRLQVTETEEKKLFNLRDDTIDLFRLMQRKATLDKIKIKLISEREFRLYAYRDHLLRVISMLLLNGLEALTESDEKNKTLTISFIRRPYFLEILINNNYGLVDKKVLPYLFRPNILTQKDRAGLGIGLYFANLIMKKFYQSKIWLKSSKKIGTTLRLKIKNCYIMAEPKTGQAKTYIMPKRY